MILFLYDNYPVLDIYEKIIANLPPKSMVLYDYKNKTAGDVEKVVSSCKPEVIIVAREETTPIEHYVANCGIPSLLVPHGILVANEKKMWDIENKNRFVYYYRLFKQATKKLGEMPLSQILSRGIFRLRNDFKNKQSLSNYSGYTRVAAYGETMKDILVSRGVKPERIMVTGNPRYDRPQKIENGNIITLFTDYFVEFGIWNVGQREDYVHTVATAVNNLTHQKLVVKIHPVLEHLEDYQKFTEKYPMEVYKDRQGLIAESKIVITLASSIGLEALVMGRPVVVYNPYNNTTPYTTECGAYFAKNENELTLVLKDIIDNGMTEQRKKMVGEFIYEQAYLQDGKSAERIANLIKEMVDAGR
jgi:hypothetical protein